MDDYIIKNNAGNKCHPRRARVSSRTY